MANRNHERIEKWLDAALDWYSSAEPRPGVENRVLARVRAEREKHATRRWLAWGVAGVTAAAAVVLIAVVLTLRPGSPPKQVAGPVPISPARAAIAAPQVKMGAISRAPKRRTRRAAVASIQRARAEAELRRDQFPSPAPLTDQEKILAQYVEEFPQQAALLARARMEVIRQQGFEVRWPAQNSGDQGTATK